MAVYVSPAFLVDTAVAARTQIARTSLHYTVLYSSMQTPYVVDLAIQHEQRPTLVRIRPVLVGITGGGSKQDIRLNIRTMHTASHREHRESPCRLSSTQ